MHHRALLSVLSLLFLTACTSPSPEPTATVPSSIPDIAADPVSEPVIDPATPQLTDRSGLPMADLISVAVSGEANNYTFAVTISSADTGCEQYADWWEVADINTGELIYRRILAHSHTNEQPFTRSGGPVAIAPGQAVVIRAHMGGIRSHYGGQVLGGSVETGFEPIADPLPSLDMVEPLPTRCGF